MMDGSLLKKDYEKESSRNGYQGNEWDTGWIILADEKYDGGYESLSACFENITPVQLKIWEENKNSVPNSNWVDHKGKITRVGFF